MPDGDKLMWGGDLGEFSVFLPNVFVDSFNGVSVWEYGRVECRRGGF